MHHVASRADLRHHEPGDEYLRDALQVFLLSCTWELKMAHQEVIRDEMSAKRASDRLSFLLVSKLIFFNLAIAVSAMINLP
jgi:hypothetical protein